MATPESRLSDEQIVGLHLKYMRMALAIPEEPYYIARARVLWLEIERRGAEGDVSGKSPEAKE